MAIDIPAPSEEHAPKVSTLRLRYGECAAEYAEVREATARDLGDTDRAEDWRKVEDQLKSDDAP